MRVPLWTGWSSGPKADALATCERSEVIGRALAQLAEITGLADHRLRCELEQVYYHDWATDPFSRGAYSYVRVGGIDAPAELGAPVEDTLFFAGEATDTLGRSGTVQAALGSGKRAADAIIAHLPT